MTLYGTRETKAASKSMRFCSCKRVSSLLEVGSGIANTASTVASSRPDSARKTDSAMLVPRTMFSIVDAK
jgi:hypothetical protein